MIAFSTSRQFSTLARTLSTRMEQQTPPNIPPEVPIPPEQPPLPVPTEPLPGPAPSKPTPVPGHPEPIPPNTPEPNQPSPRRPGREDFEELVRRRFSEIKQPFGPGAIAFVASSKCSREASCLLQSLTRAVIGANNVDNCSRHCQSPATQGLFRTSWPAVSCG
jgi:hypothetical protein